MDPSNPYDNILKEIPETFQLYRKCALNSIEKMHAGKDYFHPQPALYEFSTGWIRLGRSLVEVDTRLPDGIACEIPVLPKLIIRSDFKQVKQKQQLKSIFHALACIVYKGLVPKEGRLCENKSAIEIEEIAQRHINAESCKKSRTKKKLSNHISGRVTIIVPINDADGKLLCCSFKV